MKKKKKEEISVTLSHQKNSLNSGIEVLDQSKSIKKTCHRHLQIMAETMQLIQLPRNLI